MEASSRYPNEDCTVCRVSISPFGAYPARRMVASTTLQRLSSDGGATLVTNPGIVVTPFNNAGQGATFLLSLFVLPISLYLSCSAELSVASPAMIAFKTPDCHPLFGGILDSF